MAFSFRFSAASRSQPPARARGKVDPAPPVAAVEPPNRRLISGQRVLCRCSVELPKHDPFSSFRPHREGFIVMNVRGGSLYLPHQLNESAALKTFPSGSASVMKRFTLHPDEHPPILLGDVKARYLRMRKGQRLDGLVLRFVGLTEAQLDLLNQLPTWFTAIEGNEEDAIPLEKLHRI